MFHPIFLADRAADGNCPPFLPCPPDLSFIPNIPPTMVEAITRFLTNLFWSIDRILLWIAAAIESLRHMLTAPAGFLHFLSQAIFGGSGQGSFIGTWVAGLAMIAILLAAAGFALRGIIGNGFEIVDIRKIALVLLLVGIMYQEKDHLFGDLETFRNSIASAGYGIANSVNGSIHPSNGGFYNSGGLPVAHPQESMGPLTSVFTNTTGEYTALDDAAAYLYATRDDITNMRNGDMPQGMKEAFFEETHNGVLCDPWCDGTDHMAVASYSGHGVIRTVTGLLPSALAVVQSIIFLLLTMAALVMYTALPFVIGFAFFTHTASIPRAVLQAYLNLVVMTFIISAILGIQMGLINYWAMQGNPLGVVASSIAVLFFSNQFLGMSIQTFRSSTNLIGSTLASATGTNAGESTPMGWMQGKKDKAKSEANAQDQEEARKKAREMQDAERATARGAYDSQHDAARQQQREAYDQQRDTGRKEDRKQAGEEWLGTQAKNRSAIQSEIEARRKGAAVDGAGKNGAGANGAGGDAEKQAVGDRAREAAALGLPAGQAPMSKASHDGMGGPASKLPAMPRLAGGHYANGAGSADAEAMREKITNANKGDAQQGKKENAAGLVGAAAGVLVGAAAGGPVGAAAGGVAGGAIGAKMGADENAGGLVGGVAGGAAGAAVGGPVGAVVGAVGGGVAGDKVGSMVQGNRNGDAPTHPEGAQADSETQHTAPAGSEGESGSAAHGGEQDTQHAVPQDQAHSEKADDGPPTGTIAGAVTGGVIGTAAGGPGLGAVGAAGGALVGNRVDSSDEHNDKKLGGAVGSVTGAVGGTAVGGPALGVVGAGAGAAVGDKLDPATERSEAQGHAGSSSAPASQSAHSNGASAGAQTTKDDGVHMATAVGAVTGGAIGSVVGGGWGGAAGAGAGAMIGEQVHANHQSHVAEPSAGEAHHEVGVSATGRPATPGEAHHENGVSATDRPVSAEHADSTGGAESNQLGAHEAQPYAANAPDAGAGSASHEPDAGAGSASAPSAANEPDAGAGSASAPSAANEPDAGAGSASAPSAANEPDAGAGSASAPSAANEPDAGAGSASAPSAANEPDAGAGSASAPEHENTSAESFAGNKPDTETLSAAASEQENVTSQKLTDGGVPHGGVPNGNPGDGPDPDLDQLPRLTRPAAPAAELSQRAGTRGGEPSPSEPTRSEEPKHDAVGGAGEPAGVSQLIAHIPVRDTFRRDSEVVSSLFGTRETDAPKPGAQLPKKQRNKK